MLIFLKREERWWKSSRYIMYNHDYQNVFQNAINTIIKRQSAKWMKSKSKRNHTRWRNWLFWSEVRSSSTGYFCTASLHCITRQHLTPNKKKKNAGIQPSQSLASTLLLTRWHYWEGKQQAHDVLRHLKNEAEKVSLLQYKENWDANFQSRVASRC